MRFVATGFIIVGLVILGYLSKNNAYYLEKPERWPVVRGQVVESRLITTSENAATGESTFKPIVKYKFTYRGNVFNEGRVVPMEKPYKSRKEAKEIVERFQPNQEIDVFVNPKPMTSPRSVLIWELPDTLNPLVGIAGVLIISGILGFIFIAIRFISNKKTA